MLVRILPLSLLAVVLFLVVACTTPDESGGRTDLQGSDTPATQVSPDDNLLPTAVDATVPTRFPMRTSPPLVSAQPGGVQASSLGPSVPPGALEENIYPYYNGPSFDRDEIVPVYTPSFLTVGESHFDPDEMVIGLSINQDSRAYPVGMLQVREMVNDVVGGVPVLVTW